MIITEVIDRLGLSGKISVAVTGGGGKTTLLGVMGRALAAGGAAVLLTTTTKVQRPFPVKTDWFAEASELEELKRLVLERWVPGTLGMMVGGPYGDHKWAGIPPEWVDELFVSVGSGAILNEADGALRLPIKAPAAHEPVIPSTATHVFPLVGLSALGQPLDEAHAFRPELIARIAGIAIGEPITEAAVVRLMTDPEGLAKGAPERASIVPFLNQADDEAGLATGRRIAEEILKTSPRIGTVLTGRLKPTPFFQVISTRK